MRRLTERAGQARRDERGMAMIVLALTIVVIMTMGALVIDVGAMLNERRELQNGADAAALDIAHACARTEAACAAPTAEATSIAGANALDGVATIDAVSVDLASHRVTVRTSTGTASGGSVLPFSLGKVTGRDGQTLHATSVATWGAPARATTLPLTMSRCEFDAVAFGKATVVFHTSNNAATGCHAGPGGKDIPGGFGWLDQVAGVNCSAAIGAGNYVSVDPGVSSPQGCDLRLLLGKTLLVPIYDDVIRTGTKSTYRIVGFGAFVLTGYRFPSGGTAGTPVPCKSPNTCIGGTFTQFVTDAGPIGGTDFGVSVVKLVA